MFCSGKKSKMATALLRHQSARDHRFEEDNWDMTLQTLITGLATAGPIYKIPMFVHL